MLLANKQMSKFDKDLLPGQSQNILYLNEFDVFFFVKHMFCRTFECV